MTNESSPSGISVRRVLVEGFVIVGSILLAFGIDAWWQESREREEVERSLSALHDELIEDREQIASVVQRNEEIIGHLIELLAITQAEVEALTDSMAVEVLLATGQQAVYTPSRAALDAMLSSNVLEDVPDIGLRRDISAWPGLTSRTERQADAVGLATRQLSDRGTELEYYDDFVVCRSQGSCDIQGMLSVAAEDEYYRGKVANKIFVLEVYAGMVGALRGPLEELISQLPGGDGGEADSGS